MKQPNVLWICTDQQRHDTLGCYGNPYVQSPNLDRLAGEGTQFGCAFSQSPICTPSRASFLTGRYPRTTRCRQNGQAIPKDEVLVTKLLADAGYTCGLSGKLHLAPAHPDVCSGIEERTDDGYTEFHWSHHHHPDMPDNNEYGTWLKATGHEYTLERHPDFGWAKYGMPAELHQTTWCADRAVDFMKKHAEDETPWLFSVNIFDPHSGFDPPKDYFRRYEKFLADIPLPSYVDGELDDKPPYQAADHIHSHNGRSNLSGKDFTPLQHRLFRAAYWAMCDLVDAAVGKMLAALDATDQRQDTIVIFHSDHGEMLGDHGIYLKGPYCYEQLVHVPLIMSLPGKIQNRRTDALVELTDLAPTLLEAAGLERHPGMQGKSLWPLLTGTVPSDKHRDDVYSEFYHGMDCHQDTRPNLTTVRTATHKLTVDHTHRGGELYDLTDDPGEHCNRWNDPGMAQVKAEMLLRLANRMAWTVDPLPERQAAW